jgi:uncharacterized protein YpmB
MKKRIFVFTLIILIIIIALASIPKIGYRTGGYSPEELEQMVIKAANSGTSVKLANIKYNSVFWWPFNKTIYNKSASPSQIILGFFISLPYWIIVSLILALIIEGLYQFASRLKDYAQKRH